MTPEIKKTALHATHLALGAKMTPFAGYDMPLRYGSDKEEHNNVRQKVGIFDVSHMGQFFVRGKEAAALIQKITTNDVSKLFDGKAQYSCLTNPQGGIIDDLLVYRFSEEDYMLVVNASNTQKDWDWIEKQNNFDAELQNRSEEISLLAVQGPKALEVLQPLTDIKLSEMGFYTFTKGKFAGIDDVIVSATGYTGESGLELYLPYKETEQLWHKIMDAGKPFGILPAGLAARDTLRLEMGFCLYGNDLDENTTPLEAGLGWITKLQTDFIGAEVLRKQKEAGISRRLSAFEMLDRGIPRKDYTLLSTEAHPIGTVTSGSMAPALSKGIGMGYLEKEFAKTGTEILVQVRQKQLRARVIRPPFVKK